MYAVYTPARAESPPTNLASCNFDYLNIVMGARRLFDNWARKVGGFIRHGDESNGPSQTRRRPATISDSPVRLNQRNNIISSLADKCLCTMLLVS